MKLLLATALVALVTASALQQDIGTEQQQQQQNDVIQSHNSRVVGAHDIMSTLLTNTAVGNDDTQSADALHTPSDNARADSAAHAAVSNDASADVDTKRIDTESKHADGDTKDTKDSSQQNNVDTEHKDSAQIDTSADSEQRLDTDENSAHTDVEDGDDDADVDEHDDIDADTDDVDDADSEQENDSADAEHDNDVDEDTVDDDDDIVDEDTVDEADADLDDELYDSNDNETQTPMPIMQRPPPAAPEPAEHCALCLATWRHAIGVYNNVENFEDKHGRRRDSPQRAPRHMITEANARHSGVLLAEGTITEEKACRSTCTPIIKEEFVRKSDDEMLSYTCKACMHTVRYMRYNIADERRLRDMARARMCVRFHTQLARDDCEHTVLLYANNIIEQILYGMSSSSICRQYGMCGGELTDTSLTELFDEYKEPLQAEDVADLNELGFDFNGQ